MKMSDLCRALGTYVAAYCTLKETVEPIIEAKGVAAGIELIERAIHELEIRAKNQRAREGCAHLRVVFGAIREMTANSAATEEPLKN